MITRWHYMIVCRSHLLVSLSSFPVGVSVVRCARHQLLRCPTWMFFHILICADAPENSRRMSKWLKRTASCLLLWDARAPSHEAFGGRRNGNWINDNMRVRYTSRKTDASVCLTRLTVTFRYAYSEINSSTASPNTSYLHVEKGGLIRLYRLEHRHWCVRCEQQEHRVLKHMNGVSDNYSSSWN